MTKSIKSTGSSENSWKAKTIAEAISDLQEFFEVDLWYASHWEWKNKEDMVEYLNTHFEMLQNVVKTIQGTKGNLK